MLQYKHNKEITKGESKMGFGVLFGAMMYASATFAKIYLGW